MGERRRPSRRRGLGRPELKHELAAPDLSIDDYAALVVELDLRGPAPQVLRRHEIPTPASLDALRLEQERRMNADSTLRARFEDRCDPAITCNDPVDLPVGAVLAEGTVLVGG